MPKCRSWHERPAGKTGFLAMYVFLGLNGLGVEAEEPEVVGLMVAIAAGRLSEEEIANWLWMHTT